MCGRRTTFNYDDTGTIVYTPMVTEDAGTSGDDESDDSEEEAEEKNVADMKALKLEQSQKLNKNKEVLKHNKDARALATGAGTTATSTSSTAEASRSQGGGARKGDNMYH